MSGAETELTASPALLLAEMEEQNTNKCVASALLDVYLNSR
ncbi:hypothetical protein [Bacillus wiedmannii]|nr:hypothetical protein [Bacillus wiedmannii]SCL86054.1 Uncharacterized protein BCRIVMBC120_00917 [Bacillus wiedmannii]